MPDPGPGTSVSGADVPRGGAGSPGPGPEVGLTSAEAAARLATDGPNAIGEHGGRTLPMIVGSQLASPLVLLLLAACVISIGAGDAVDAGIIIVMVVLSVSLGVVQEARSEHAVAALRARLALTATTVRDGLVREVPVRELVRGDIVRLAAGDIVPADARLTAALPPLPPSPPPPPLSQPPPPPRRQARAEAASQGSGPSSRPSRAS